MGDIDFDEIDKAVEGAINKKKNQGADNVPVEASELHEEVEMVKPARRGRFMDMIHPSSDMLGQRPLRADQEDVVNEDPEPAGGDTGNVPVPDEDEPDSEPEGMFGDEPAEVAPVDAPEDGGERDIANELADDYEEDDDDEDDDEEDLTPGPFLSGTKVEKRPLGGGANVGAEDAHEGIESTEGNFSTRGIIDESDEHRAMYDSEEISDTTVAPSKKKSGGWVILLVILGVVIAGAGAGAAVFFFLFK